MIMPLMPRQYLFRKLGTKEFLPFGFSTIYNAQDIRSICNSFIQGMLYEIDCVDTFCKGFFG